MNEAQQAAQFAARFSYGRLLAALARRTNDLAGAEDALGLRVRPSTDELAH